MADRRGSKHNPHSSKAMTHRRQRAVGLTGAICMFLTLGLGPLATAPKATADEFDVVIDQVLNAITASLGDVAAGSAAGSELGSLSLGATESTAGVGLGSLSDVGSVAAASPVDAWLHGLEQDWIDSGFGQQVDTAINSWFNLVDPTTGACGLICNGADGVGGGTLAQADGQGGGLIFGDSGNGAQPMSQNLLVNPGFETADPSGSGFSGVTIPGWTETGTPTVIAYGTQGGYPLGLSSPFPKIFDFPQAAPPGGGDNFAGGGPVANSSISQTVDLIGAAGTPYTLSADLGGQGLNASDASVQVTFLDAHGDVLGTGSLNPVTVWDRLGITGFEERDISGTVPEGTTSAQVTTTFTDNNPFLGNYNFAYADNESFTVGDPSLTPAPLTTPTSDVGQLDHVFLIYMENKGAGDIVGSPNAPYINSLIDTNGYADNYYALGHPSDPNYFRIMGGSDFGIDYNPVSNVIDAPSLMQEMDQAGISWAGYAQSMPSPGDIVSSGDYSVDELPFAQFGYVFNNTPAYLQEHLLPLTELPTNLADPSSFPEFTWIAANEANNMEGPVDTPSGLAQFIATQFTDHQYNVAAGDQFVQQEVSAIENSPTWTDPTQKDAIIVTFDEDNNNLSLGFGNEGNNVPMIVIPNGGAVTDGGMESGPFTTSDYYNEYSLMATIEDALRTMKGTLDPLTANDMYA
ncbi:MAG: alkaline phosphatase family protein, partial [Mycobacterium sp.]|uniref:alkaline phosphatase family protein n=1 Tax=Mycobacterium sp. TaxID=1785 RepID=UPI003BAF4D64